MKTDLFRVLVLGGVTIGCAPMEAQIISLNAVGYADVVIPAGTNLIANPFNATDNSVSNLLRAMPDGSAYTDWNPQTRASTITNTFHAASGWQYPDLTIDGERAAFLWVPAGTAVSFAGELWGGTCVSFPLGQSVVGFFPERSCAFCDPGECPPPWTGSSFTVVKVKGSTRTIYSYEPDVGGWDMEPSFEPGEGVVVYASRPFTAGAKRPFTSLAAWTPMDRVALSAQLYGDGVTVSYANSTNGCCLLSSTNLDSTVWRVIQQQAHGGNGFASTNAPVGSRAFYRVTRPLDGSFPILFGASRVGTQFAFEFYAPSNATYSVQRSATFAPGSWQTVRTISAEAKTVVLATDTNAPASLGYYRVSY